MHAVHTLVYKLLGVGAILRLFALQEQQIDCTNGVKSTFPCQISSQHGFITHSFLLHFVSKVVK